MLVVIINSFYDNTRLSAYKDGSCSFFDAYTFTDQLWNLSYTPKWPGVTNEKNDRGRKTYQLQNYRFPDTHWNSWGKCDNGDLAQDNSWDFLVNKNNPAEFQIFNSQYPTYRFGAWEEKDNGDATGGVYKKDHDYPDQFWNLKTPFIAKPKWIVADDEWNNGDAALDMKFMMQDGFTKDVVNSILIDEDMLPGMMVPPNEFMMTMTQTFTELSKMLRMNMNNTNTLVASVENSLKRANDPSYMDQYLRNHPVYCTADPGKHMCLYQLQFDMEDIIMVQPWTFQTSVYGINECQPDDKKGMPLNKPSIEAALYSGECGY